MTVMATAMLWSGFVSDREEWSPLHSCCSVFTVTRGASSHHNLNLCSTNTSWNHFRRGSALLINRHRIRSEQMMNHSILEIGEIPVLWVPVHSVRKLTLRKSYKSSA